MFDFPLIFLYKILEMQSSQKKMQLEKPKRRSFWQGLG